MKIVMRFDEGRNGFVLAEQECENAPVNTIFAKAYCEYGANPTKIVIEMPDPENALVLLDEANKSLQEERRATAILETSLEKQGKQIEKLKASIETQANNTGRKLGNKQNELESATEKIATMTEELKKFKARVKELEAQVEELSQKADKKG